MRRAALLLGLLASAAGAQPAAISQPTPALQPVPSVLPEAKVIRRWNAPEARQGVAVDATHFYAVVNSRIGKYRKSDGMKTGEWVGDRKVIRHLNSCVIEAAELVCANSNFPLTPMASSVEIFDPQTMKHKRSVSLGVRDGSLTWVERHDGRWWAGFANYDGKNSYLGRTHRDTKIVLFDEAWREVGGYALPDSVLERFPPDSNSGGSFGPDGLLYMTGHDAAELYVLRVPALGPVMEHVATVPAPLEGQAWAWDRREGRVIYGITRKAGEVVVMRVPVVAP